MRNYLKKVSMLLAGILISCGGGSDSTSFTIQGRVIDDPIPYASVCLDINNNYMCDPEEPQSITDESGYFTLEINDKKGFIVAQGKINNKKILLFSADLNEYEGKVVVSPLTTLYKLYEESLRNKEYARKAVEILLEKELRKDINFSKVFEDYVEKNDNSLQNIARQIGEKISKVVEQSLHEKSPYTFLAAIEGKLDLDLIDTLKQKGITEFPIISARDAMVGKKLYFMNIYTNQGKEILEINGLELRQGDNNEYWCYSKYEVSSQTTGCEDNNFQPVKYLEWKDLGDGQIEVQHADLERLILRKFVELDLSGITLKGCDLLRTSCDTCIGRQDILFPRGSKVYAVFSVRLEGLRKEEAINRKGWYEDGYKSEPLNINSPNTQALLEHLSFKNSQFKPGFYYDPEKKFSIYTMSVLENTIRKLATKPVTITTVILM